MNTKKNKIALAVICLIVGILHLSLFAMDGYFMGYTIADDEMETTTYTGFETWETGNGSIIDNFSKSATFTDQEGVVAPILYTSAAAFLKIDFVFAIVVLLFGAFILVKTLINSEAFDKAVKDTLIHKLGLIFIRLYFWINFAAFINLALFSVMNVKSVSFFGYTMVYGMFPFSMAFIIFALGIVGSSVYKSNYKKIHFANAVKEAAAAQQAAPQQQVPYQQAPYQQAPYQQAPYQQAPYQQAPQQQAPQQQVPYQQAPYQQAPYQQAPYQQAPQQQVPYQQAPQQAPVQNPAEAAPAEANTCANCGAQLANDAKFCNNCGTAVEQ